MTKLNRTQYKVLVESKEQAEQFKQVLLALREKVSLDCFEYYTYNMALAFKDGWIIVNPTHSMLPTRSYISIKDLAKLIVNEAKPILTSVDGVDLYEGDDAHWVIFLNGKCEYLYPLELSYKHNIMLHAGNDTYRLFHTREAAEAWIAEQNKPKEIVIERKYGKTVVSTAKAVLEMENTGGKSTYLTISSKHIEEMYSALKSLS